MTALRSRHVDPRAHRPHPLHSPDRIWVETNCYVDVWIELLGHLRLPPEPGGLAALSSDALSTQWSFLKYQVDDLRTLYGIAVGELNVWRSVEEHVVEVMAAGDLVTLECDSWFLPDTAGTSYRAEHVKTTIVPVEIDPAARTMTYLHNAGQFVVAAEDYDGVLAQDDDDGVAAPEAVTRVPFPYVELVSLSGWAADRQAVTARLPERALDLARAHLSRAPGDNPAERFASGLRGELPALAAGGMEYFHRLSFATTRQLGLSAQGAADGLGWLAAAAPGPTGAARDALSEAARCFTAVAGAAKRLQFGLARVASGRGRDLEPLLGSIADGWSVGMERARAGLA